MRGGSPAKKILINYTSICYIFNKIKQTRTYNFGLCHNIFRQALRVHMCNCALPLMSSCALTQTARGRQGVTSPTDRPHHPRGGGGGMQQRDQELHAQTCHGLEGRWASWECFVIFEPSVRAICTVQAGCDVAASCSSEGFNVLILQVSGIQALYGETYKIEDND